MIRWAAWCRRRRCRDDQRGRHRALHLHAHPTAGLAPAPLANPACLTHTVQVELLLTLEEYCAEEGDFSGEQGAVFAPLFPQVGLVGRGWGRPAGNAVLPFVMHVPAIASICCCVCLQVIKLCYDHDLLTEEAILDWAHEKEHAGSEDRRFVNMCADLLAWLEDAEEESSDASE